MMQQNSYPNQDVGLFLELFKNSGSWSVIQEPIILSFETNSPKFLISPAITFFSVN